MKRSKGSTLRLSVLVAVALSGPGALWAQAYPTKPIRFVVTTAAGGGSDIMARLVGGEMEKRVGAPIVVENRRLSR